MRQARRAPRPLDQSRLDEMALRYVGRFATTRAKLRQYLLRKVRERGWEGLDPPAIDTLVDRFSAAGYVDDQAYAVAAAGAHRARGLGKRRLATSLRVAGVEEGDGEAALALADDEASRSALQFARRKRLGPFAGAPIVDRKERERATASMIRAGHSFAMARQILDLSPEDNPDFDHLVERLSHTGE